MGSVAKSNRNLNRSIASDQLSIQQAKRRLLRDALRPNEQRDFAFRRMILSIPAGKVSTYGRVAAAAGYPQYHRAVAKLLRDRSDRSTTLASRSGSGRRDQAARRRCEGAAGAPQAGGSPVQRRKSGHGPLRAHFQTVGSVRVTSGRLLSVMRNQLNRSY